MCLLEDDGLLERRVSVDASSGRVADVWADVSRTCRGRVADVSSTCAVDACR